MKMEYLATCSRDCPLIRLYDFTPEETRQFLSSVTTLASGEAEGVEVHRLPFVEAVGPCRLTLVRRSWDQAVIRVSQPAEFERGFTAGTRDHVAGLGGAFAASALG